jgi:hypothetical protein
MITYENMRVYYVVAEVCVSEAKRGRAPFWQGEVHVLIGVMVIQEPWDRTFLNVDGAANVVDLWHQRDQCGHRRCRPEEGGHHFDLRPWYAMCVAQVTN